MLNEVQILLFGLLLCVLIINISKNIKYDKQHNTVIGGNTRTKRYNMSNINNYDNTDFIVPLSSNVISVPYKKEFPKERTF